MTITLKKEVSQTAEVKLPSFWKDHLTHYALIDEDNIYSVYHSESYTSIMNGTSENMNMQILRAIDGTEITEEEFMEAYNKAMKSLYLKPILVDTGKDEAYNNLKNQITY